MNGREIGKQDSGCGGTIIFAFSQADCALEAGRTAQHGGKVMREKFAIDQDGFTSFVEDTESNMIGLHLIKRLREESEPDGH